MGLEALALIVCINGAACDDFLKAYYLSKPGFKYQVKQYKNKLEEKVGKEVLTLTPAFYAMAGGHNYSVKITRNITFNKRDKDRLLIWTYEF